MRDVFLILVALLLVLILSFGMYASGHEDGVDHGFEACKVVIERNVE